MLRCWTAFRDTPWFTARAALGFDLYILRKGESLEEFERRESAHHFGYRTRTMVELERLAEQAGTDPVAGMVGEEVVSPTRAGEMPKKLRAFLADVEPGPSGSFTDQEMLELAAAYASFCEQAAEQGGIVIAQAPLASRHGYPEATAGFNNRCLAADSPNPSLDRIAIDEDERWRSNGPDP